MRSQLLNLAPSPSEPSSHAGSHAGIAETLPFTQLKGVEESIHELLASWQRGQQLLQRRRWHRIQFAKQIQLTPLDERTEQPLDGPRCVTGKDISLFGVSFLHTKPLPYGKVALAFELPEGSSALLVTRLSWCRFTRAGAYHSGGKFLRQLAIPADAEPICWQTLPRG